MSNLDAILHNIVFRHSLAYNCVTCLFNNEDDVICFIDMTSECP